MCLDKSPDTTASRRIFPMSFVTPPTVAVSASLIHHAAYRQNSVKVSSCALYWSCYDLETYVLRIWNLNVVSLPFLPRLFNGSKVLLTFSSRCAVQRQSNMVVTSKHSRYELSNAACLPETDAYLPKNKAIASFQPNLGRSPHVSHWFEARFITLRPIKKGTIQFFILHALYSSVYFDSTYTRVAPTSTKRPEHWNNRRFNPSPYSSTRSQF